jgi:hypothetical protein
MKGISNQVSIRLGLAALSLVIATAHGQISGFGGNGTGWTLNNGFGAAPTVTGNVLNIVNGYSTANSAFYNTPENISDFTASFVWQNTVANDGYDPADGMVFTLQNQGLTAVGYGGSGLGYQSISPATGVALNLFQGHTVGLGYAPNSTGNGSDSYQSTGSVDFDSTDPMSVIVSYSTGLLDVSVTDEITSANYSTSFGVDLPADAGGNTAYVGFTGGSGGGQSDQTISDFSFTSSVPDGGWTGAFLAGSVGLLGMAQRRIRKV